MNTREGETILFRLSNNTLVVPSQHITIPNVYSYFEPLSDRITISRTLRNKFHDETYLNCSELSNSSVLMYRAESGW